jgi:hypothetical protein
VHGASLTTSTLVLSHGGESVSSCALEEDGLSGLSVLALASPCLEDTSLKGTTVRESESPRSGDLLNEVHGIEVKRSIFLRLSTGKEGDSGEGTGDGAAEGTDGSPGDLSVGGGGSGPLRSRGDHVGLEEASLDDEVVSEHLGEHSGEDALGDGGASLDRVVSVNHDLGLNDGYEAVVLADTTIAGESVGGLVDGELGRSTVLNRDLEDTSPFGESASLFVEGLASSSKSIKTLSGGLVGSSHDDNTLVDLNSRKDTSGCEVLDEVDSSGGVLAEGLLEHDDSTDVLLNSGGGEEKLSVGTGVLGDGLNTDSLESESDGTGGLIGSKDSLTGGGDLLGVGHKLGFEVLSSSGFDHSECFKVKFIYWMIFIHT